MMIGISFDLPGADDRPDDNVFDRIAAEDIDTEYTREVICPWCGHKHRDPWEMFGRDEDTETDCESCGKRFAATQHVSVSFSTHRVEG